MSRAVGNGGRWVRALAPAGIAAALAAVSWLEPSAAPADPAHLAYVGPGAGFAFLGSFLSLIAAFLVGAASLLAWPLRVLWRSLSGKKGWKHAKVRKVIFLGLDGYDPDLAERFMSEGKLPNLAGLRGPRQIRPPADDLSSAVAGCLVYLRHRRQPGQAQPVRLPESQHADLLAGTLLVACAGDLSFSPARQMAFSAGKGVR